MNKAYEALKKEVDRLAEENSYYSSWEEIEGLEYVTTDFYDERRWSNDYLHIFRKDGDIAGVIIGEGKTENQENDKAGEWSVVEVEERKAITYVVK
jgi:hypothetical protein